MYIVEKAVSVELQMVARVKRYSQRYSFFGLPVALIQRFVNIKAKLRLVTSRYWHQHCFI